MTKSSATVLIIEDDFTLRELLIRALDQPDITFLQATDGESGLRMVREAHPNLILLDLGLPDISGIAVLEALKSNPVSQSVPVIILTAQTSREEKIKGFNTGADDYISKPFDLQELRARIRVHLRTQRLKDELSQKNLELEAAAKRADNATNAKADFLAQMSHEIRTPMNAVLGMSRLLVDTGLDTTQKEMAETIRSSAEHLLNIINNILDFSKIEAGKLSLERAPFPLRSTIEDVMDLLAPQCFDRNVELTLNVREPIPPRMLGDMTRLRQVLVNLVGNAVKFTKKGEVEVTVEQLDPGEAGANAPGSLQISVRDTGVGIPADKQAQLFTPFSQADAATNRQFGGTGLGLAICKQLTQLMRGDLSFTSESGVGSIFKLVLPLEKESLAKPSDKLAEPVLKGKKVLIVDDNATNLKILGHQTRRWGMEPTLASSAKEALEHIRAGDSYSVVLTDLRMPEMDGAELAAEIHKLREPEDPRIILLTSMGNWADTSKEQLKVFSGFISKPIKADQLLQMLKGDASTPAGRRESGPKIDQTMGKRLPARCLIVDDNEVNQKVSMRMLKQMGYAAELATNGLQAVDAMRKEPFDIVLMDVQMPVMDGFEATRQIREMEAEGASLQRSAIIAMTARALEGDREKCLAAGMDDYLAKPVRSEALQEVIERWAAMVNGVPPPSTLAPPEGPAAQPIPAAPTSPIQAASPPGAAEIDDSPISIERLREFTDGTDSNLVELAELYLEQTGNQMKSLESTIPTGALKELRSLAHSAAGSSGTCGAVQLSNLLRLMEAAACDGNLGEVRELNPRVQAEFARVKSSLDQLISTLKKQPASE